MSQPLREQIFQSGMAFEELALKIFHFQSVNCPVYRRFLELLGCDCDAIRSIDEIPFLPIELFKTQEIITEGKVAESTFTSSGTGQSGQSRHCVAELGLYKESMHKAFTAFYGPLEDYHFFPLLPSYLERQGSSLIYMVKSFMEQSNSGDQFYLYDHEALAKAIRNCPSEKKPFLIGVSFALLDLAENHDLDLSHAIVMETGGMKGRRREITRAELHRTLKNAFHCESIHSEYGMTELLSQAYSKGDGRFHCPPWMDVRVCDLYDPMRQLEEGKSGLLQVIDLANLYSCSFIATSDMGKLLPGGGFEVLGRLDHSDLRGCNLMVAQSL